MKPNLPYQTLQDIAAALKAEHFQDLYSLPYNRFDLSHSQHWWLSPTHDKAAFKYGKAIFTTDQDWVSEGQVFCGFNVEKGLTSEFADPASCLMQDDWFWHRFKEISSNPLAERIGRANSQVPIQIILSVGELVPGTVWSRVRFSCSESQLQVEEYKEGSSNKLESFSSVNNYQAFHKELKTLDGAEYTFSWADVMIGSFFTQDSQGVNDLPQCASILDHFQEWMRP